MKVFINKRSGSYSGGLAVVAANTKEEAHKALCDAQPDMTTMVDSDGDYCLNEEDAVEIRHYNYDAATWSELPMLIAHVDKPQLLEENGHSE